MGRNSSKSDLSESEIKLGHIKYSTVNTYGSLERDKDKNKKLANGKTETTDSSDASTKPKVKSIPYTQLFRYASASDKFLLFLGTIASICTGASQPVIIVLFSGITKKMVDYSAAESGGYICPGNLNETSERTQNPQNPLVDDTNDFVRDLGFQSLWMMIAAFLTFSFTYFYATVYNTISEKLVYRLRQNYLSALLRQNVGWYDTNQDKNFVSRISEDLMQVQEATGEKFPLCLSFMSNSIICLGVALYFGWELTLVNLTASPVLAICTSIAAKMQSKLASKEQEFYAKAGNVAEECLSNIKTATAFSGAKKEIQRYEDGLLLAKTAGKKRGLISSIFGGLMWLIIYSSYALAFWYGTKKILKGREDLCNGKEPEYEADNLLIVFFCVLVGGFNIGQSAQYFEAFAIGKGAAQTIYSVIDRVPEIDSYSENGQKPSARATGKIDFKNVKFSYPSREVEILKGFSLSISAGQTVAVVGFSGCGKSTCLQLLQRFYDTTEGSIYVDDVNIKDLHLRWLRSQIGVVNQEPILFNTTIVENIRYGRDGVTQEEIEKACRQSNAHQFISKLPQGYATLVGDRGAQLSGGQKQRIAIARALVRNPPILLLDEATSALDTQSESLVQTALDKAREGRTTLIVAHRLSTIRAADVVVSINNGQVSEIGTHNELLKNKGLYFQLVTAQMQGHEEVEENLVDDKNRNLQKQISVVSSKSEHVDDEVIIAPATSEDDISNEKTSMLRLLKMNSKEWHLLLIGLISSVVQGLSFPLYAIILGNYLQILAESDSSEVETKSDFYSIIYLIIGLICGLSIFCQTFAFSLAGEALTLRLRKLTFGAMLNQEMGWYDEENNSVGALCSRLSVDAASIKGVTGSGIGQVIQALTILIAGIAVGFYYVPKLAAVSLALAPLIMIAAYFHGMLMTGQNIDSKKASEDASKIAVQCVSNIRTVASLCKEKDFVQMYNSHLVKSHERALKLAHARGLLYGFARGIGFFSYAVINFYGAYLIKNEGVPFGDISKVGEALIFGSVIIGQTIALGTNFTSAKISWARIAKLLDRKPKIDSSKIGFKLVNSTGSVKFENVEFNYATRPTKILKTLSFEVESGKTIALVGLSGSGKSTCIQLILRFYDPTSGKVMLDEHNISTLNLESLRSQMAIVAQEPVLFDRTIAENIAYGDNFRKVPMDEIIKAAKLANIHNFISSIPSGYETRVGEMGSQLSGGQKQRIAISRALVRNPKLLLLDEATSALDTESEALVQEALDAASSGRTSITIAHRLSSITHVDKILVIDNGEIIESGSHSQLLEIKGLYYKLWNRQGKKEN